MKSRSSSKDDKVESGNQAPENSISGKQSCQRYDDIPKEGEEYTPEEAKKWDDEEQKEYAKIRAKRKAAQYAKDHPTKSLWQRFVACICCHDQNAVEVIEKNESVSSNVQNSERKPSK